MSRTCKVCSGTTQWDEGASSIVCIDCGYLEDSSQTVLTSGQEPDSSTSTQYPSRSDYLLDPFAGSTLRNSHGRALHGQSSKGKHSAAHSREMHQYISSVLRNVAQLGVADRAIYLFDLAMQRAGYRWGRQAKLAAGACIMIALNQRQRGETVGTIAAIMSEPIPAITKVYARLSTLLDVGKVNYDPSLLLPSLQAHLTTLLNTHKGFPAGLKRFLIPLSSASASAAVLDIASELTRLLLVDCPAVKTGIAPSIACAVFILGLEAIALQPVPSLHLVGELLGARFGGAGAGASKWAIADRYNSFLPVLLGWKHSLPWQSTSAPQTLRKSARVEVSKSLRDVVMFRVRTRAHQAQAPSLAVCPPRLCEVADGMSPEEELKDEPDTVWNDPLMLLERKNHSGEDTKAWIRYLKQTERALTRERALPRSRLQTMLMEREGGEKNIADEELFDEGELEGLMRGEEEVEVLRRATGWEETTPGGESDMKGTRGPEEDLRGSIGHAEAEGEVCEEWREDTPSPRLGSEYFLDEECVEW